MARRILLVLAVLGAAAASSCSGLPALESRPAAGVLDPRDAATENLYRAGKEHLAAGRFGSAVQSFQSVLARRPDDVAALNGLGATYDRLSRFDLADQSYMRALTVAPNDPMTLNNIGWSRHLRGQQALAGIYLREAATLAPGNPVILANVGKVETPPTDLATPPLPPPQDIVPRIERRTQGSMVLVTAADGAGAAGPISAPLPAAPGVAVAEAVPASVMSGPVAGYVPARAAVPAPAPPPAAVPASVGFDALTIEVSNGNGRTRMAARTAAWLGDRDVPVRRLTNAETFRMSASAILYRGASTEAAARRLAEMLPVAVPVLLAPHQASDLRLVLGADLASFDSDVLMKGNDHDLGNEQASQVAEAR